MGAEELRDVQGIKDADNLRLKADKRIEEDEARIAGVEEAETDTLRSRAKQLHKQAQKFKGSEKDTVEAQATLQRAWGRDAKGEANAAKKHNGRGMVTNHNRQKEEARAESETSRQALA